MMMMIVIVLGGVLRDILLLGCAFPTWEETPFLLIAIRYSLFISTQYI